MCDTCPALSSDTSKRQKEGETMYDERKITRGSVSVDLFFLQRRRARKTVCIWDAIISEDSRTTKEWEKGETNKAEG